jgi:hypothetical protein
VATAHPIAEWIASQMVTISECQWPCPHEQTKAGYEDLALRAGLTADAAPSGGENFECTKTIHAAIIQKS